MARMPPRKVPPKAKETPPATRVGTRRTTRSTPLKHEELSPTQKKRAATPTIKTNEGTGKTKNATAQSRSPKPASRTKPPVQRQPLSKELIDADDDSDTSDEENNEIIREPIAKKMEDTDNTKHEKAVSSYPSTSTTPKSPSKKMTTNQQQQPGRSTTTSAALKKLVRDEDSDSADEESDSDDDDEKQEDTTVVRRLSPGKKGVGGQLKNTDAVSSPPKPPITPQPSVPSIEKSTIQKVQQPLPKNKAGKRTDVTEISSEDKDDEKQDARWKPKPLAKMKASSSKQQTSGYMSNTGDDGEENIDQEVVESKTKKFRKTKLELDEELSEGMNLFALMDSTEIKELLERISGQATPADNYSVQKREDAMDWEQISFAAYGPRQCRAVWSYLKSHTRSYRIMAEVVTEVQNKFSKDKGYQTKLIESLPGFPQKGPTACSAFSCFNREEWNKEKAKEATGNYTAPNYVKFQRECRLQYEALPANIKDIYVQQSQLALAEYRRNVKKFYAENPGLAQYIHKLNQEEKSNWTSKTTRIKPKRQTNPSGPRSVHAERIDPYEDAPRPPHSPAMDFMQSKLNALETPPTKDELPSLKQRFFAKWEEITKNPKNSKKNSKKRLRWIENCVQDCMVYIESSREFQMSHPGYNIPILKMSQLLSKEEVAIWESANGKPSNTWNTAYDMFLDGFLASEENLELSKEERSQIALENWNEMTACDKEIYTLKFKMCQVEYKKELQAYYASLPDFMKPICLKNLSKKFVKMLAEVDKASIAHSFTLPSIPSPIVQPDEPNELLITAEDGVVYSSAPKSKKAKKRKRERSEMESEAETGGEQLNRTEESDTSIAPVPKKKKKKKKRTHDEDVVEDDGEAEYHPDDPAYHILQKGKYAKTVERAKRLAESKSKTMIKSGDQVVHTLDEEFVGQYKQPSTKYFPHNNAITKNDIFESIRGIFDARALGGKFSIYYYYAKYVAADPVWIDSVNSHSLEQTGIDMIKTFLSLPAGQQDIFIHKASVFHDTKRRSYQGFPNEPKPPLKFATSMYRCDVSKKKRRDPTFVPPTWTSLPETVQRYYTKKLYHETKLYMRRYDEFISRLTPSEFVEYAVHRYKIWERNLYTKQSIPLAVRKFAFPIQSNECAENNVPLEVGAANKEECPTSSKMACEINNPFTKNKALEAMLNRLPIESKRQSKPVTKLSKDMKFSLLLTKEDIVRENIKRAEMYDYPIDDILSTIVPTDPPIEKNFKRISQGTQTVWVVATTTAVGVTENN